MKKLFVALILGCSYMIIVSPLKAQNTVTYLALGDSYTIGEAVKESERWPVVVAEMLKKRGLNVKKPHIIATTGWTTDELMEGIEREKDQLDEAYGLVSLLIGVNNQYRGYNVSKYKKEFKLLLEQAVTFAGGKPENVFVVSIPDYGVTPFAEEKGLMAENIEKELAEYNTIAQKMTLEKGCTFFDITPISLRAIWEPGKMVASDGLHPSGEMYKQWADYMAPGVYRMLTE